MSVKSIGAKRTSPFEDLSPACALIESAPFAMAMIEGPTHILRHANAAFCRLIASSREEVIGKSFCEIFPEKDECTKAIDRVLRTGIPECHTEEQHSFPAPWSVTLWPVMDEGNPAGVAFQVSEFTEIHRETLALNESLIVDSALQHERTKAIEKLNAQLLTENAERKQAEHRLRLSEIRYRRIFEAARGGILIIKAATGKITEANPYLLNLLGCTNEQIIGKELCEIGILKNREACEEAFRELKKHGFFRHGDVPFQTPSGDQRELEVVSHLYQENGDEFIQCTVRDITERKCAANELAEKARLLDLSNDAIIVRDFHGRIRYWNRGAEELYGWTRKEALGKRFHTLLKTEFPETFEAITTALLETNRWKGELVQTTREGKRITVLTRKALDRDANGDPRAVLEIATDITKRKRAEEALRQIRAELADRAVQLERLVAERTSQLQATHQQLEAFVYSIAHDLRGPLRAMQGFSAMLVREVSESLSEKGKDYARRIDQSARFMDEMIKALLDFRRISQETIELHPVNLEPLILTVLDHFKNEIKERHAQIENPGLWPVAMAHQPTLIHVLCHLISNALKFHRPGVPPKVRLWAERRPDSIRIWVQDNGVGIAHDHQNQIFRIFNRLAGNEHGGTGIGLAIVEKGVERMGGQVGVESTPGEGSRFWLELRNGS